MGRKKQPRPDTNRATKEPRPPEPEQRYPDRYPDKDSGPAREPGLDEETGVPVER